MASLCACQSKFPRILASAEGNYKIGIESEAGANRENLWRLYLSF
jgi:hypothetical protein